MKDSSLFGFSNRIQNIFNLNKFMVCAIPLPKLGMKIGYGSLRHSLHICIFPRHLHRRLPDVTASIYIKRNSFCLMFIQIRNLNTSMLFVLVFIIFTYYNSIYYIIFIGTILCNTCVYLLLFSSSTLFM